MLLNARRLRQPGDQPPLILLAMEDITDRKRVEETHQLLLAATSHDVLNVLNNIVGYAQLLEGRDLPEPVVPRIISLSMALREIMRELLDHADAENDQTLPRSHLRPRPDPRTRRGDRMAVQAKGARVPRRSSGGRVHHAPTPSR